MSILIKDKPTRDAIEDINRKLDRILSVKQLQVDSTLLEVILAINKITGKDTTR